MKLFHKKNIIDEPLAQDQPIQEQPAQKHPSQQSPRKFTTLLIMWGIALSFAMTVICGNFYEIVCNKSQNTEAALSTSENISWLYQSCLLLYGKLYNVKNGTHMDYVDLYLDYDYNSLSDDNSSSGQTADDEDEPDTDELKLEISEFRSYFANLEKYFSSLNSIYYYIITDNITGDYVTNMLSVENSGYDADICFWLSFIFDEAGNVSVGDSYCENSGDFRKKVYSVIQNQGLTSFVANYMGEYPQHGTIKKPSNCTVTYLITQEDWALMRTDITLNLYGTLAYNQSYMIYGGNDIPFNYGLIGNYMKWFILATIIIACIFPFFNKKKAYENAIIFKLPVELLAVVTYILFIYVSHDIPNFLWGRNAVYLDTGLIFIIYFFCFFTAWYIGICARAIPISGLKNYIKKQSLIYRFGPATKKAYKTALDRLAHIDLTKKAHRTVIQLVLANAVALSIIIIVMCMHPFFGICAGVIYSAFLYFLLRGYVGDVQKKYNILFKSTNEMAQGNLNVVINEDMGIFEPIMPQLLKIQDGFKKAVDEEVKSQRMKAELITNVSHDLKTPLTAIITYTNLLKGENITDEQRRQYTDILEKKSLRLKVLIDDLFEVSKANSRNVTLNIENVDIVNLIKQVVFEMSDKLNEAALDVRINFGEDRLMLPLDSQKTYRIYENLLVNAAKYSIKGTRVYIDGHTSDNKVIITVKNVSAQEITVDSSELTERFVRGDASRNTEGSGLGLAIAKSFAELQGGELAVDVDGDLFKVTTVWNSNL